MLHIKSIPKVLWMLPGLLLTVAGCNQNPPGTAQTAATNSIDTVQPAAAEVTEPNQPVRAYVRAVHTVRGAGPVALAVDGENIVNDLRFGDTSEFVGVHGDKVKIHSTKAHQISVVDAANKTVAGPLSVDLERGEDVTIVLGGALGKITLKAFEHTNRGADFERAKVAVLHTDKALPEIGIAVDGKNWPGDIGYGEVTGYKALAPGAHTMKVMYDKSLVGIVDIDRRPGISPPPPVGIRANSLITLTQPLSLEAGKVYSVIVYADAGGQPKLHFLEDKFVPPLIRAPDAATSGTS